MADQSPADQTPPSSGMQSLSVDSQPPSSSSTPQMSLEEKFKIIRSVGEECIQEDELLNLLNHKPEPICYDGFEPSGRMHIALADICQLGMDQRKVNVLAREFKNFEMLEELDISDNQIRVLPESFRLLSKLRVFRADETPLEVPPREVIKLGAQAVVEFMADLIAKRDTKAAPPKKEKGFWFRICSICWTFQTTNTDDNM
ncbi:hypothetical protein GOBAR_AA00422 [Gossypium barbadense]|nr:hypothetical protein GOBAR_AA00422 [Gossypium barbadense]